MSGNIEESGTHTKDGYKADNQVLGHHLDLANSGTHSHTNDHLVHHTKHTLDKDLPKHPAGYDTAIDKKDGPKVDIH